MIRNKIFYHEISPKRYDNVCSLTANNFKESVSKPSKQLFLQFLHKTPHINKNT